MSNCIENVRLVRWVCEVLTVGNISAVCTKTMANDAVMPILPIRNRRIISQVYSVVVRFGDDNGCWVNKCSVSRDLSNAFSIYCVYLVLVMKNIVFVIVINFDINLYKLYSN